MSSQLARRYASALFEVGVERGLLKQFHQEFQEFIRQLEAEPKFEGLLRSPLISNSEKKKILREVFEGHIHKLLLNFIYIIMDARRQRYIKSIFKEFQELVYERLNILVVKAVSAIELNQDQLAILKQSLHEKFQKEIIIDPKVDPSIMGGLILYAGGKVLDGSLGSRIIKLRSALKDIGLREIGVN